MITPERLAWLKENKEHGDIAAAVKSVNPKNNKNGLKMNMANNIMSGTHWGKWGKDFTDALEIIIRNRQEKLQKEKELYSTETV